MTIGTLQQAIDFIKAGDKQSGGKILFELVKAEPQNELAWLWLSACYEKIDQKRICLEKALAINPENPKTKAALQELNHVEEPNLEDITSIGTTDNIVRGVTQISEDEKQKIYWKRIGIFTLITLGVPLSILLIAYILNNIGQLLSH